MADLQEVSRRLALVGAGHAHLFVLEALAHGRLPPAKVTLIAPQSRHLYSGMVGGLISGRYREAELSFDLESLAAKAGSRFVQGRAVRVDTSSRRILLEGGEGVEYDMASFAIGADLLGADLPGVREYALLVKPIDQATSIVKATESVVARPEKASVVVVGGGAGGIELALNLSARLRALGLSPTVCLVDRHDRLMADRSPKAAAAATQALARHRIGIRLGDIVEEVGPRALRMRSGAGLVYDILVWATGPRAPEIFGASALATDSAGFLAVDDTLRSVSHPMLFAAGDSASLRSFPATPKSGVYAVREGPVLTHNLAVALAGGTARQFRRYRPQGRSLALLNTGDGRAIFSYGSLALTGTWVMRLKDRIDRRFMRRFQQLAGK